MDLQRRGRKMKATFEKGNDESGKQTQSVGIIFKQERMYIGYGRLSNTMWITFGVSRGTNGYSCVMIAGDEI